MPLPLRRISVLLMLLACSLMQPRALTAQPEGQTGWPGGGTVTGTTRDGVLRGT